MRLIKARRSEDAVFAFRALIAASPEASRADLLQTAAWMTREAMYADRLEVMDKGQELKLRLDQVSELETLHAAATDPAVKADLSEQLARARAGLSITRSEVSSNARAWNLRSAKTMLRSYRELARAGRPL